MSTLQMSEDCISTYPAENVEERSKKHSRYMSILQGLTISFMFKSKYCLLIIVLLCGCSKSYLGSYRTKYPFSGGDLVEIKILKGLKFIASRHLCNITNGKVIEVSKYKIILESDFQNNDLSASIESNNKNTSRIILRNFPKDYFSSEPKYHPTSFIDSVIFLSSDIKLKITDTLFENIKVENSNTFVKIYTREPTYCSSSLYEYKIPYSKNPTDYIIFWDNNYFNNKTMKDTFYVKNRKILSKTDGLFYKKVK